MSLFTATIILALILVIKGSLCLCNPPGFKNYTLGMLRSKKWTATLLTIATVWFTWHLAHLGEADFGNYRHWLIILFVAIAFGSYFFVKDFLIVRAWAVIILLLSNEFLKAAFLQEPATRLFLVGFVYLMIIEAIYFAAVPFQMRDFLNWLFTTANRMRLIGCFLLGYGILLTIVAFTY